MAGVGKLLKQAQKMQRELAEVQKRVAEEEIEVSSGGGAVVVKVNGLGEFISLNLDEEFLKEDAKFVSETVLEAVKEAAAKAKSYNEQQMSKVTSGLGIPGMM